MPRLHVVIVNYRTPELVEACLESLVPQLGPHDGTVTVVDNASGDGSADYLKRAVARHGWETVAVDAAPDNGGFGYGNNRGLRRALADEECRYVFLLNPDTRAAPGCIATLIDHLESQPAFACAGPRIVSEQGVRQNSAFRFPSVGRTFITETGLALLERFLPEQILTIEPGDEAQAADWVSGAAIMAKRELFERVGLFDEEFFLYFEELDLLHRAAQLGLRCAYVPAAKVVHLAGASTQVSVSDESTRPEARRPEYWFDSRRRYFEKHLGFTGALAVDAAFTLGYGQWLVRQKLLRRPVTTPPHFLRDLLKHRLRHPFAR